MGPALLLAIAAFLYASVGHGGASGYIAALSLMGHPPDSIRASILVLNILVSAIAFARFFAAKAFDCRLFWPLAVFSVPAAFIGGAIHLDLAVLKTLIGAVLLLSAATLLWRIKAPETLKAAPSWPILGGMGAVLGLLSGLTGVGGGIFLSPLLVALNCLNLRTISGVAAAFIFVNSASGLLGRYVSSHGQLALSPDLPYWLLAAFLGGLLGAEMGSRYFNLPILRLLLAAVLAIAAAKMFGLN